MVFLDEPTIGLDISVKAKIRSLIKELNRERNTTIILTTHDLGDVEALCRRIIIIDKGKILYDGNVKKVNELFGAYRTLKLQINDFNESTIQSLKEKLSGTLWPRQKLYHRTNGRILDRCHIRSGRHASLGCAQLRNE